jgi:pyruvate dehydrogenase E2 component (dihydrolipoamide acetyltransferase)
VRFSFHIPDLGEGLAEAELLEWHASPGDQVVEDAELVDVQTDKAIVSVPCPVSGTLLERHGKEGDTIAVGALLAVFETATAPVVTERADVPPSQTPAPVTPQTDQLAVPTAASNPSPAVANTAATSLPVPAANGARVAAAPSVRRLAHERGIDLRTVVGSGPGGRVLADDLEQSPASAASQRLDGAPRILPAPQGTQEIPMRGVRKATARAMTSGWQTIPHIFDFREAEAGRLMEVRRELRAEAGRQGGSAAAAALTPLAVLIKIAVAALAAHPEIHGYVDAEREMIVRHGVPHLGIAVATPDGLLTPVLRDVHQLSVLEIGLEVRELVERAVSRKLTSQQLSGATFLVNNLGALGSWYGTPLIPPGLGGNLGFGRVVDRPVIRDGGVVAGQVLPLSISADHRLVDGDILAAFAGTVVRLVENPDLLIGGLR